MEKRISGTENRDMQLLAEVENVCPMCGKILLGEKAGKVLKRFHKAHIYPHSPNTQQKETLKDISPPSDIESMDNLIALCKDCHERQDVFTTKEDYLKLYELKQLLAGRYLAKSSLSEVPVESDILKVLKELEVMEPCEVGTFVMDPIPIKQKIHSGVFQNKVLGLATLYYPYLRFQFQNMDSRKTQKFAQIATQIKLAFLTAENESMFLEDIFNQMVEWLVHKTLGCKTSCEVVIAFFIQDCEVFHAVSK